MASTASLNTLSSMQTSWWNRLSLRTKATVLAIVLGTVPVLGIGGTAYYFASESFTKSITQAQQNKANSLGAKISQFMAERNGDIQILSSLPIIKNPKIRAITSLEEKEAVFNRFLDAYLTYDSIAVFDLDGNVIVQSIGNKLGNHSDRKYFQDALKTGLPVISAPEVSKSTGKISIHFVAAIKDQASGKNIAVVRARMPINRLDEIIRDFSKNGDEYHVIDQSGTMFLASEKMQIGRQAKNDFSAFAKLQSANKAGTAIDIDQMDKAQQFLAYAPLNKIPGAPLIPWEILIATDTKIAFATLNSLLFTLELGIGVTILLVGALAAYLANRATRPIVASAEAVAKIGQGELSTRVVVSGQDEIATLGSNINSMAQQIQTLVQSQTESLDKIQQSEDRLRRQNMVLMSLSQREDTGNLIDLLQEIVEAAVQTLGVERASVWFYNETRSAISCADLYERTSGQHSNGIELSAVDYPEYFKALHSQRVIAAHDAHIHPATREFSEGYLTTLGINSVLDAQIQGVGTIAGVLCCEHIGPERQWTLEEQTFITSLSEAITLAMQSQERERAEAELRASEQEQREKNESLQRELLKLLMEVESASDGDLTVRADVSAGEIGIVADFFNAIIESMRDIVAQVKESAAQVNTSLSEDEEAMGALAQESLQQTQKIQKMLESVENMAISIQEVANNASQAAKVARTASSKALLGGEAMDRTVDSILQLRETVADTSKKVKQLGESSQQISKVVSLINQIALQTNLLAINASIEAARAGEEGRGFAVVAEEVGALAAQSAAATKDIEKLVESIQYSTSEVVDAMERGTTQVVEGSGRVEEAKLSLGQIIEESRQIDELVQSISEFTVSQTQTSEMVKTLMQELTQSAALSSESSGKVSHSIRATAGIAAKLQDTVDTFKVVAQ